MELKTVLIADSINEQGINDLKKVADVTIDTKITQEELIKTIDKYNAIIVRSRTKITKEVLENASQLKIIARAGVGIDNVDVDLATEKGIMVVNAPESTSITVAEQTMGLMLSLSRKIAIADHSVKEGKWEKNKFLGIELNEKTLGIIGMGRIGSQVVTRSKAFGMDAIVYDPYINEEVAKKLGVDIVDLDTIFEKSDVISIHVPLTRETKHLISVDELNKMKDTAFILNCARGGIIDEDALFKALTNDKIGGVGLDVYETEPPKNSPLLKLDNVVLTPHIGASTVEAQRDAALIVAQEVINVFKDKTPKNVLNMPVLNSETYDLMKDYIKLAESLGKFISKTIKGNIYELNVTYCGKLSELPKKDVLSRIIMQELLNPVLNEPVNMINAPTIIKKRGIKFTESKSDDSDEFDHELIINVKTDERDFGVEGIYKDDVRIIKINEYSVDVKPKGNMFIVKYKDLPGTIGIIGTKFGEYNINIATMQVGRKETGGEAIMILEVDQGVPDEVLNKIIELKHVEDAIFIEL